MDVLSQEVESISFPSYIDSSILSTWRSCRRKFFWSTISSLSPVGKSVHLIAGGAFAAGMEAARRMAFSGTGDNRPSRDDILQAAFKAFLREWGDYQPPEESPKSLPSVFQALVEYLTCYPPETDIIQPLISPAGNPTVEYTFSIPLDIRHPESNEPILFVGRFDLLGSYNGLPCIVDEKTTTAIGFAWADQWKLRGQFMGYCWACQQHGININTAVIRGIGLLKKEFKFATAIETYPQHLIERWHQLMLQDITRMVAAYRVAKEGGDLDLDYSFPYNFADSCSSYGGCSFAPLCLAKDPSNYLSAYTKYRWNPLAKQPLEELKDG
jgi:hypothetical protein